MTLTETKGLGGYSPANVSHHLQGVAFPATRGDLETCAESNGADESVLEIIRAMPDHQYGDMADVLQAVGDIG